MVIKLEPMMNLSDQMERLYRELSEESDEVTRVFRSLQNLSGMERIMESLQICRSDLEQQAWMAHQHSKTLAQVVRWYDTAERRIRDEYEDNVVLYPRTQSVVLDLSSVADYLK